MAIRRKTRETHRHERATVLQQLATPTADVIRQDIANEQRKSAELRRKALNRENT
jgi:hypothetical protein